MAYIYQIVNDINQKVYVGKTEFSIERRFKEHCKDAFRERNENRPLYRAMRKYGIEHFHVELLEETDNPNEREVYWIEQKRSFKYGYNATRGGDGKRYLDYDVIIETYKQLQSIVEVAKKLNIDDHQVSLILRANGITIKPSSQINREKLGNPVNQFTKDGEYIQTFPSVREAAITVKGCTPKDITGGEISHITDVCKGKRKTAYGYKWEYANKDI